MTTIIKPGSLSFDQIKSDILTFIESRAENAKWRDFYRDASAGGLLIDLMASQATYSAFHSTAGQREAYLSTATRHSSAIAIAQLLGYSAGRGRKQYYKLKVTFSRRTPIYVFNSIGKFEGEDVVPVGYYTDSDTPVFRRGHQGITIPSSGVLNLVVVVGRLGFETLGIPDDLLRIFRFISPGISEDFQLYLYEDGATANPASTVANPDQSNRVARAIARIDASRRLSDLIENEFVALSNTVGGIDVFSLNKGEDRYTTSNVLRMDFIRFGPEVVVTGRGDTIDANSLTLDDSGSVIQEMTIDDDFPRIERETVNNIRVNAPSQFEASGLVRSRTDYNKLILSNDLSIVSVNSMDISPATIGITYVKADEIEEGLSDLLTESEKEELIRQFRKIQTTRHTAAHSF